MRNAYRYKILVKKRPEKRSYLEDLNLDRRINLIFECNVVGQMRWG